MVRVVATPEQLLTNCHSVVRHRDAKRRPRITKVADRAGKTCGHNPPTRTARSSRCVKPSKVGSGTSRKELGTCVCRTRLPNYPACSEARRTVSRSHRVRRMPENCRGVLRTGWGPLAQAGSASRALNRRELTIFPDGARDGLANPTKRGTGLCGVRYAPPT